MKISILGAGNIGGALGKKWLAAGHEVVFGVRDSQSAKTRAALENAGGKIRAVSIDAALQFGQVVLISIPWEAVPALLAEHAAGLENKIVVDATNHFAGPVINNLAIIQGKAPSAVLTGPLIRWVGRFLPVRRSGRSRRTCFTAGRMAPAARRWKA